MSLQPLSVLLVAEDRVMLRHLSKFLLAFGYEVRQAADIDVAQAALQSRRPEFLVIDETLIDRGGIDVCHSASSDEQAPYVHTLMLAENPTLQDFSDVIQSGVDDFLAKPVVYGELLARLRAGARSREFERRWREQSGVEPVTGLANRQAVFDRLARIAGGESNSRAATACVLFDIDSFNRIESQFGRSASRKILRQIAATISAHAGDGIMSACFGNDRFAVLLGEYSDVEAFQWAERFSKVLADDAYVCGEESISITASFGVAACVVGAPASELVVTQAEEALAAAKSSGRHCVARYGQFADEAAAWADLATPGRLFEHTVARDVMTPCTITLREGDSVQRAATLLAQTKLYAVPVVDSQGRLVGAVTQETDWVRLSGSGREQNVSDVMKTNVPSESEFTTFAALVDFFADDPGQLLIIVDEGRPTGMITRGNLASLSNPLTSDSFLPEPGQGTGSEYLLVADESFSGGE